MIEQTKKFFLPHKKGFASGEFMASQPGMTKADKNYYKSKKYKGNQL
ncbi:hypothetical protein KAI92_00705 [Candidatus Parcubacteria bacterium]|nr:hypothetical protein [Candidatus Parcubacteria bacterium]